MPLTFMASRKPDIPPTTSLALHKASGPASGTKTSSDTYAMNYTPTIATPPDAVPSIFGSPLAVAPLVNPQTACRILSLSRELRDMIYAYTFTSNFKAPVDGNPQTVELDDFAATVPSSDLLLTCRHVEQEAAVIFRAAQHSFWSGNTVFSIDLNDEWEGDDARKERHFDLLDLLDKAFLLPDLSDEQVNSMETFVVNVRSDLGNFKIHLDGKISPVGSYWRLNQDASTWGEDPIHTLTNGHYPHRTLFEAFHATGLLERNRTNLMFAHRHFHITCFYARGVSERRYKSMSASREMLAKLEVRRAALVMNPPSMRRVGIKKRQLEALLDHCWIVWRARRAA